MKRITWVLVLVVACKGDEKKAPPLCNLYVTMLQRQGIEVDRFGSSTGTLTGLERVG